MKCTVSASTMRKWPKVKKAVNRFAVESTFHGVQHIVISPKLWMRIIWVFLVSGAIGISLFQLYYIVGRFVAKPIITQTKVWYYGREK